MGTDRFIMFSKNRPNVQAILDDIFRIILLSVGYHIIIQIQKETKTRNWIQYWFRLKCWNNRVHNSHKQLNKMQSPAIYINILLMQVKVPNEMHNIYVRMGYVVSSKTSLIFWNWNTQNIIMLGCIQPKWSAYVGPQSLCNRTFLWRVCVVAFLLMNNEVSVCIKYGVLGLFHISSHFLQILTSKKILIRMSMSKGAGEKGIDLTQSYDKSTHTDRKIQKATWQHKNATKTSITQRLRTDLGRSVRVTTKATHFVWFNRFTVYESSH